MGIGGGAYFSNNPISEQNLVFEDLSHVRNSNEFFLMTMLSLRTEPSSNSNGITSSNASVVGYELPGVEILFSPCPNSGGTSSMSILWGIWRETKPPPVTYTTCKVDVSCILPTLQKLQHVLLSLKIFDIPQLNMLSILAFCQVCDGGADKMEMKVRAPATTKKRWQFRVPRLKICRHKWISSYSPI